MRLGGRLEPALDHARRQLEQLLLERRGVRGRRTRAATGASGCSRKQYATSTVGAPERSAASA